MRPLANMFNLAKALKELVAEQVIQHIESNNLLNSHQFGYRKNHSLQVVLVIITDNIRRVVAI